VSLGVPEKVANLFKNKKALQYDNYTREKPKTPQFVVAVPQEMKAPPRTALATAKRKVVDTCDVTRAYV